MANYTYGVSLLIANIAIAISAVGYAATFADATLTPLMTGIYTIFTLWLANSIELLVVLVLPVVYLALPYGALSHQYL